MKAIQKNKKKWNTLTEYDTEKYQPLIDARIAAAE